MTKVLWLGDAGCHTGFARVTHSIGERLVDDYGHDVHVLGYNYRGDSWPSHKDPDRQTPLKLYRPNAVKSDDIWGMSRHIELLAKIEPEVVVMVHDANILLYLLTENGWDKDNILLKYRPIITYIPVDGYNRPPAWNKLLEWSERCGYVQVRAGVDAWITAGVPRRRLRHLLPRLPR